MTSVIKSNTEYCEHETNFEGGKKGPTQTNTDTKTHAAINRHTQTHTGTHRHTDTRKNTHTLKNYSRVFIFSSRIYILLQSARTSLFVVFRISRVPSI